MDAIEEAALLAEFELVPRMLNGQLVYGWQRGTDTRFPCFLTEREAVSYMEDRLRRMRVFA
jgi:hypothetical protein